MEAKKKNKPENIRINSLLGKLFHSFKAKKKKEIYKRNEMKEKIKSENFLKAVQFQRLRPEEWNTGEII